MLSGAESFPSATEGRYRWTVVALLWWVCFFNYADRQAIYSVFPMIKHDLHLSNLQLGFLGSAFMWMYALTGPVAGWMCDRLRRKWIILGALLFWSMTTTATALVPGYPLLVLVRALSGLGEAFYFPAALSLIGDYHPSSTRSRAMSLHQSSVYVGTVAGGGLAAWIAERSGWHQSFLLLGAGGILLSLVLAVFLREPSRLANNPHATHSLSFGSDLLSLGANPAAMTLIGVFVGANFVASAFLIWLPTYLFQHMHLSVASAGLQATLSLQSASILGVLLGGWMADRFARSSSGGRMRAQAIGLLCGFPFLLLTGLAPNALLLLTLLAAFGFCKGVYDSNIWASLYDVVEVSQRGFSTGMMNSIGWLGGGLAPVYIALMSRRVGMGVAMSSTALLYLVLGGVMLSLSRRLARAEGRPDGLGRLSS